MHSIKNYIYNLNFNISKKINNLLIRFFIKKQMLNLLCFLMIFNLKRIKELIPRKKISHVVGIAVQSL